ncbi:MAG TPA: hypothetical protein VGI82_10030 [Chitinophagaceae bacterium]
MKKILIGSILFFSLYAKAQNNTATQADSTGVQVIELPDSTAIGAPDGKKVSKEIGSAGGAIVADDGRVELIFPDGALTATMTISIQPTANLIPNGNGRAYQFEPSGIHFIKPVELIFHYTQEEEETCPPLLKFMAIQNGIGKWSYIDYDDWDSSARTLKGSILHFSGFADGNEVELLPAEVTLKVGHKQTFFLRKVHPPDKEFTSPNETDDDELPPLPAPDVHLGDKEQATWYVNNILKGNKIVGSISPINEKTVQAEYIAPGSLTSEEVTVKSKIRTVSWVWNTKPTRIKGKIAKWRDRRPEVTDEAVFTCKVHLYDEYKITVSMNYGKGSDMEWNDASSFFVKVGRQTELSGIQNNMLQVVLHMKKCKPVYTNEGRCTGLINVAGLQSATIDPNKSSGQGFIKVNLNFLPAQSCMPIFDFSACKDPTPTPPFYGSIAFPVRISFEAKGETQILSLGKGNGAVVKKADPDDITAIIGPVRD